MMSNQALAEYLEKPVSFREAIVQFPDQFPITPLVASGAADKGIIIAGSAGPGAFATKVDTEGKVLWNYTIGFQDPVSYPMPSHPEFGGVVTMPDGSIFLCGHMGRPRGSSAPTALLAHLDPAGHVLSENLLASPSATGGPDEGGWLQSCIQWGDGLLAMSVGGRVVRPMTPGHLPETESWFRFVRLDAAGNVQWERHIAVAPVDTPGPGDVVLLAVGPDVVLSAAGSLNTELLRISASGDVLAQKKLSGRFLFVRPVVPDGVLQLFGNVANVPQSMAITLDEQLNEIGRVQENHPQDFLMSVAYRMPDRSLVLFGSGIHNRGPRFTSRIVHVDGALQKEQYLEPGPNRSPYRDLGSIWAAAPAGSVGEFVVARSLVLLYRV
jgi:hypothetical protein